MVCKGTCAKYKANKPLGHRGRYELGQKRCSCCQIFVYWDGRYCPCCGYPLKTKPKSNKARHRLMTIQQIKRI